MLLKSLSSFTSPLSTQQVENLKQLTSELTAVQLAWVSGYLSAISEQGADALQIQPDKDSAQTVTILYGSQTGNGRGIATSLAQKAQAKGFAVELISMNDYKVRQLKQETLLIVVVSTHGEGEAPDDAIELHKFLSSKRAPKLDNLQFSVLALGDSSYEFFCQTGKDFYASLTALGAKALLPVVECDVDYEEAAKQWQAQVVETLEPLLKNTASVVSIDTAVQAVDTASSLYQKQTPYNAEILVSQKLTGRDSDRDVRHVEIELGDSGIQYQPGDALGVWFTNNEALVDELIARLNLKADERVKIADETLTLRDALIQKKELTQLNPKVISTWAELSLDPELKQLSEDKGKVREFILNHQVIDLVSLYPASATASQFVDLLRNITPRLYSIASSQSEVDSEVHLTVALVEDEHQGEKRFGGASQFLAQAEEGGQVQVYVEPNKHFRLPEDPLTPVIMIGPGTGVAPFRAFMQQRAQLAQRGDSWLFFGNPHFEQDFLYQTEWQQYLKSGQLTRIDLAFSRDQANKIYVQHRILEQGEAVWQWLNSGAHIYICGDADKMAKDVHQALIDVVVQHGDKTPEQAAEYLDELRSAKRYQKDVY